MIISSDIQILSGLIGGIIIGVSALLLLACNGNIAGISGIVGNAVTKPRQSIWQWFFIAGLLSGATVFYFIKGSLNVSLPSFDFKMAIAAVLVGVGTRIGSGCTSGHGVCGIGRGSLRSIGATAIFMLVAVVTVAIIGR